MNDRTAYTGIDEFRLAAALLVITIHTSPLASCSETGDFFLTRVIARVAVPFFLMASGFFLISQYARDAGRLWAFLKKTAVLYGISIAVYLPLNLYNGYFSGKHFLPELIKDLVFDGTMYHLWYLPASMLGAGIAWYAVRRLGFKKALIVTLGLYAAGLLGDSYYGIAEKLPILSVFYQNLFEITDYTRNGIFFAPVFLVMGGMAAEEAARGESLSLQICGAGLGVSFLLMSCEGLLLRELGIQRHDSMYLFLLPCMYFLFRLLLFRRGSRKERIRTWALLIYIIHPMMIVGVRLLAKLTGLESLLIQNSLVHFLAVSALSVGCGILAAECCGALYGKKKRGGRCSAMRGKARLLNQQHKAVKVHVKVDTGMHRLGFGKGEADRIAHVFSMKYLKVCGIYTHLCAADSLEAEDVRFTKQQIGSFYGLLEKLKERGIAIPKVHIQSSYGFLNYPELPCDYVRAGIALYGVLSAPGDRTRLELDLRPVLSLKSKVVLIRKIRRGESVGYGRAFTAERDSRIAVLPLGYGDGLPRNLSCGRTQAVIRGQRVPVIGRICMDQLMVDITDAHGIFVGDTATFIGWDGSMEATAPDLADQGGTITNELLSRLGGRLTRTARACFRTYTF